MPIPVLRPAARSALQAWASALPIPPSAGLPAARISSSRCRAIYGLPTMTNYAIGGARTDNTNTLTGQANPLGPPNPLPVLPGFASAPAAQRQRYIFPTAT